jgi:hypothetical protein
LKGEPVLFLDDLDRNFRTIGLGKPRLLLKSGWDGSVADLVRIAETVEFEQFGRQRFAPGVTLALVLVDADPQLSGHFDSLVVAPIAAHLLFQTIIAGQAAFTSAQIAPWTDHFRVVTRWIANDKSTRPKCNGIELITIALQVFVLA